MLTEWMNCCLKKEWNCGCDGNVAPGCGQNQRPCAAVTHSFVLKTRRWFSFNSPCKRSRRLTSRGGCGPQNWSRFRPNQRISSFFANVFKGIYLIFELLKLFENSPRVSKNRIDLHLIENVYSVAICLKGGDGSGRRGFVCRSVEANWKWMKREMKFQNGSSLNSRINGRPLRMLLLLLAEPQR